MVVPFALNFGIRPWEMDLLTHEQFLGLERAVHELRKERERAGG